MGRILVVLLAIVDDGPNRFLAAVGLLLIAIAAVGLFIHENQPLSGTFLFLGVTLVVISVFEPRMEDEQSLSPGGLKFNLGKAERSALRTDSQAKTGTLIPLDEEEDD
jgi:hypothetical protein